ncbi:MAG: carbon-nitrogen hydrolase family protein [Prolixibacteraceae bacterium]|nr:carbon-nitrogen hydrolase family protein [Paludibacter sp.]MDD4756691.1 carbon-nitrogen hydrolase family protein [Prolixibacteraceae bacterium]
MANQTRRNFVKNISLGTLAVGVTGVVGATNVVPPKIINTDVPSKKPREVWIATITQHNIGGNGVEDSINSAIRQMGNALPFSPDVICLPEAFHVAGIEGGRPSLEVSSENGSGNIIRPFQEFAKKHNCYIICPIYTTENGKYYNAAVIIDRQGQKIGEYRKVRLTVGEMERLTPGPREVPVFKTDFGVIGIQICFDILWDDGWRQLGDKGAEIVFWPSAFAGGKMVNTFAWQNYYCVVSSTRKDTSKICDITGEELAVSGNYSPWGVCAPVNLEKAFLHSWPYNRHFPEIQRKYGKKVRIYTLHEEEFSIIESLSEDVKVADILKEFDLKTHRQHKEIAEKEQDKFYI